MSFFSMFRKPDSADSPDRDVRMSPDEFVQERALDGVVIDVRTAAEYGPAHVEGSRHIDVSSADFPAQVARLDMDPVYYVYCRSGARSQRAAQIMRQAGFKAFNIGGLQQLERAGATINRP